MKNTLSKRNVIVGAIIAGVALLAYWYLPVHITGSNPKIESLIDQLASTNPQPKFPGDPPHFYLKEFLETPGGWNADAQKPVSAAYYELKSMGKAAFPYLIKHFDDERYSHERSSATFSSHSVGEACRFLIDEQVDLRGVSYKGRETPNGSRLESVAFNTHVNSKFGSYAAWWRSRQNKTLIEMRIEYCHWRIEKEKQIGFVDAEQETQMLKSLNEMLNKAKEPPEEMPLPPTEWYSVDAIVQDIEMSKMSSPTAK